MSAADYFTKTALVAQTLARATAVNANLTAIEVAFGRLPDRVLTDTGRVTFAAETGAADVYVATMHKTPAAYYEGMTIDFKVSTTNTGASTINVDGLGAKTIKNANNSGLVAGDMTAGDIVTLKYDGTNFRMTTPARSLFTGNANMGDDDIKAAYERNADTNALTDALKAKIDFLTITGAADIDAFKTKLDFISVSSAINLDELGAISKTSSGAITAGDPVAINSDGTISSLESDDGTTTEGTNVAFDHPGERSLRGYRALTKIEKGRCLCVLSDEDDPNNSGMAFVVTFDEDDPTSAPDVHASVEFEASDQVESVQTCLIAPNKVLAVYIEDSGDTAQAIVFQIIGNTVIPGSPVQFEATASNFSTGGPVSCCKVADNKAVVFAEGGSKLYVCTVSGLTPSFGTGVTVTGATTVGELTQLAENSFFFAYDDSGDSNYLNGVSGTVDGTSIDLGTEARVYALQSSGVLGKLLKVDEDGYKVGLSLKAGRAVVINVAGDTFSVTGSSATVGWRGGSDFTTDGLTFTYQSGSTLYLYTYDMDIDTGTFTFVDGPAFETLASSYGTVLEVGHRHFLALWEKSSSGYMAQFIARESNRDYFIGFATETVADAETCGVKPPGTINSNQSGLTPLKHYYIDWDATLTQEVTDIYAGLSLSATEILVGGNK